MVALCTAALQTTIGWAKEKDSLLRSLTQQLCIECHNNENHEAGINLEVLTESRSFAEKFLDWRRVRKQLELGRMPPVDAEQPSQESKRNLLKAIDSGLTQAIRDHDGDPGPVVIRRLTSAEYASTIEDLTGIRLDFERSFVSDAVGGAGFTNTGIVQFTQDSTLERYLEAARRVANHTVIGAGPLTFHRDAGPTGLELSAITRIMNIYRAHGFRTAAGEGGESFGLDRYPRAFYVAWIYQHREALKQPDATLARLAQQNGIDVRFAEYIHELMMKTDKSFPTSEVIAAWRKLPAPKDNSPSVLRSVRRQCDEVAGVMHLWQNRFGANVDAKEEAPVLRADLFEVTRTQPFEMNINWPEGTKTAHLVLSVESALRDGEPDAVVIWHRPRVQFRIEDRQLKDPVPLREIVTRPVARRLQFGRHPRSGESAVDDFVTVGTKPPAFEIPIPPGASSARLLVTAELDTKNGENCIVRCRIAQLEETDQGKSISGLLADPESPSFAAWKTGVLEFARLLPQVSQREPAPSDRDPIPAPVDPTYNNPERNLYHTRIKYHRDDQFLVDNILDDETRHRLDLAWADLLGSFEYHDEWLRLIARKFDLDPGGRSIADSEDDWIASLPAEPRQYVRKLRDEFRSVQTAFHMAQPGHVDDVIAYAERAWRRPLQESEQAGLRSFYKTIRTRHAQSHSEAIRTLITRVLVSPQFLYRAEQGLEPGTELRALSNWELASRLSYFLWSSLPDDELRQAAAAGTLQQPDELARQARRMLRDPRAKRFATEFFGQWFGFYRFDRYQGIDPKRFPEFSDRLKSALYQESVLFFDHIVRHDRPLREILFADYSFMNRRLAEHYGVKAEFDQITEFQRIEDTRKHGRGGLLHLGSVLAITSAPLRTSPVKRGDWVLRRVLGTAVPPPPADAGSIPADDVLADGKSVRQRLVAHRREASCVNCHSRIDPFGFALEQYDPLGRRRKTYRDGSAIDTSGWLRDGTPITGDDSLHEYLQQHESQFHRTLCTKLLGYALGRREMIGDQRLLERMTKSMQDQGHLSHLVEHIVVSRQFRYHGSTTKSTVAKN